MIRSVIVTIILLLGVLTDGIAQDSNFSFRLDITGGNRIPLYRRRADNPFIGRYGALGGYLGVERRIGGHWSVGIGIRYTSLLLDKEKTAASIREHYQQPGLSLSAVDKSGNPEITNIELGVSRRFRFKKIDISPFVQVGVVGWMWVNDFSLYQKRPNEHYYVNTKWTEEDGHNYLFPLMSTIGLRLSHRVSRHVTFSAGIQYTYGIARSFGIGLSDDFDGVHQQSFVTYRQPISLLQGLIGINYRVFTNVRSRGTLVPIPSAAEEE